MVDVIDLISERRTVDEYGDIATEETSRRVFCRVQSIGTKEFYQAQATGMQPEIKFILSDYLDYQGEMLVDYAETGSPERYRVLRTYQHGKELEITCMRGVD